MTGLSTYWRRLALGFSTVTGLARRGYFIPYRYAGLMPEPGGSAPYAAVAAAMAAAEPGFRDWLDRIDCHMPDLAAFQGARPPSPRWEQDWFPRLDGAAAYAMVRHLAPERIVEVGSGHSSRFMMRAIADGGLDCRFTAIDPAPRADLAGLDGLTLIRKPVQEAGDAPFRALQSGDILFIDSSHILMPGSDVDLLFNRILPALPSGVMVHIHDITLPDDYPRAWGWRGYNEQLGVIPLITAGGYDLEWSSWYVARHMAGALTSRPVAALPLPEGALETSLWLRKR